MKKLLVAFLALILYPSFSNAQRWDSLSSGLNSILPYLGVNALCVYNGNLYAGGSLIYVAPSSCIASWNGNIWSPVGNGIIDGYYPCGSCCTNGPNVSALATYNGSLFVGGFFNEIAIGAQISEARAVAQWNGALWDSVGTGVSGAEDLFHGGCFDVSSFAVYNGEIYMGGAFQYTGDSLVLLNHIAKWNGTSWSSVDFGINGTVNCLTVYNGNLYAGGGFDSAGGIPAKNIAMWNGIQWSAVGGGVSSYSVNALCVYNGSLYVGGSFDSAGGQKANNIASWNGSTWSAVTLGILPVNQDSGVDALTIYGTDLCVGGQFNMAGSIHANNIALWDGSTWSALGTGVNGYISALTTYNGALIAGGVFDTAGGVPANNIAEWLSPLGINNLTNKNISISVYPNPTTGIFTISLSHPDPISESQINIHIYNVLGEKVYSQLSTFNSQFSINISNQPTGVYLYRVLSNDGGLIGEGKIVVE